MVGNNNDNHRTSPDRLYQFKTDDINYERRQHAAATSNKLGQVQGDYHQSTYLSSLYIAVVSSITKRDHYINAKNRNKP